MIDDALRAFLERGCAAIVGTVAPDGMPHAQRGWGISVTGAAGLRIALDGEDPELRDHLDSGCPIAITAADVRDLRSVQLKGRVVGVEEPTAVDLARCEEHNIELFRDIEETDHYPAILTERMVPPGYVMAIVDVDELYDQTPGPGAGARVAVGSAPASTEHRS